MGIQSPHRAFGETPGGKSSGGKPGGKSGRVVRRAFKVARVVAVCAAVFLLLASVLVMRAWAAPITIDAAHFPDPLFRVYVSTNFDKDSDGILSDEEAGAVEDIYDEYRGIKSFKGIEYFPNLLYLSCYEAPLTSLDLSRNTALQGLVLENVQIGSLDLSKNTALEYLEIRDAPLTSLDLSRNTALYELTIEGVQLDSLDLRGLPNLEYLDLCDIQVSSLELRELSALREFNLYAARSWSLNNQIASLTIEDNPVLEYVSLYDLRSGSVIVEGNDALQSLYLFSSEVDTLAVRDCAVLEYLDFTYRRSQITTVELSDLPALRSLYCYENQLVSLSLDKLPSLEYLDVGYGPLTSLSMSELPALISLSIDRTLLTSLDTSACPNLEYLSCSSGRLESLDVSGSPALRDLNCSGNRLGSLDVSGNTALEYLGCSYNPLGSLDVRANPDLYNLDCSGNLLTSLDVSGAAGLSSLYCENNLLTSLDLSGNPELSSLYCPYNSLTSLDLSGNPELSSLDCLYNLLTSLDLSDNPELHYLYCSYNSLTSLDLSGSPEMYYLDCSYNLLTSLDLSGSPQLSYLGCGGNRLLDVTLATGLQYLYPWHGGTGSQSVEIIVQPDTDKPGSYVSRDTYGFSGTHTIRIDGTSASYDPLTQRFSVAAEGLDTPIGFETLIHTSPSGTEFSLIGTITFVTSPTPGAPPTGVEINEANFPDSRFRVSVRTECDLDGNDWLSEDEAAQVTDIQLGEGCSSAEGIEHFPELEYLYCYGTTLTSLDLSKNPKLRELHCYDSRTLSSLDISKNSELEYLRLSGASPASLDVSNNTKLQTLDVYDTLLTSLDVSGLPAFEYLYCQGNSRLTSFTVGDNPLLRDLTVYDTPLTSLDVSGLPALEYLSCSGNQLTSLTVGDNPSLQSIGAYDNLLTSLDVSDLPALEILGCDNNQLASLTMGNNPLLRQISVFDNLLASLDVGDLPALEYLECSDNLLTSLDVGDLPALLVLYCPGNRLTSLGLSGNAALTSLNCSYNQLTSLDVSGNPSLTYLYCSYNGLLDVAGVPANCSFDAAYQEVHIPVSDTLNGSNVYESEAIYRFGANTIELATGPAGYDGASGRFTVARQDTAVGFTTTVTSTGYSNTISGTLIFIGGGQAPVTYTVTFKDWDGTVLDEQEVAEGTGAMAPSDPTRTGYTFTGWDTDFTEVKADLEVKATYTPIPYTVTFAPGAHGAFTAQATENLTYGDPTPAAPDPEAEPGWEFTGWSPTPAATVTGHATYTATWEQILYSVTIEPGDHGTDSPYVADNVTYGTILSAPAVPAGESGWKFIGWQISVAGAVTGILQPGASYTVTDSVTLTAQWQPITYYTVIFKDWDGTVLSTQTVAEGDDATAPADPVRTGHIFFGWHPQFANVTSDLVVKAVYEQLEFSVTIEPGEHGLRSVEIADFIPYGSVFTAPAVPPGESSWEFTGWLASASGVVTGILQPGDRFTITDSVTLVAQWQPATPPPPVTFTVTFDSGTHGTGLMAPVTVDDGSSYTVPTPTFLPTAGYTFDVWQVSGAATGTLQPGMALTITGDVTLTAAWQPVPPPPPATYTVTFKDWDGTVLSTQTVEEGADAVAPTPPTRTGYTFFYWTIDFTNVTSDLEVWAVYMSIPYTVIFQPGDHGTSLPWAFYDLTYGTSTPIAPEPTAEPGWEFTGWSPTPAATVTGHATYTATWQRILYSVTIEPGDHGIGSPHVADNVTYGSVWAAPAVPAGEAGWRFTGWQISVAGAITGILQPGDDYTVTGSVTLVAQWQPITYYLVTFIDHDGTPLSTQTVEEGTDATAPADPMRMGYTFTGWDTAFTKVASDLVVKAVYEPLLFSVGVEPGEHGTDPAYVADYIPYGSPWTAPTAPPGEPGWEFTGWLASGAVTGILQPGDSFTITGSVTLTAQWQPASAPPPATFTVTFEPGTHGTGLMAPATVDDGSTYTLPAPTFLPAVGYTFDGWLASGAATGTLQPGANLTVTGDITLTAAWQLVLSPPATFTVTFVDHDGTVLSTQTVEEGTDAAAPAAPVRTGWDFIGWDRDFANVTSDITVTAVYDIAPLCRIDYLPGDHGSGTTPGAYVREGTRYVIAQSAFAPDSGWEFTGWLASGAVSGILQPGDPFTITGSVTLTAQWQPAAPPPPATYYTVTFVDHDGAVLSTQTVEKGTDAVAPAAPTRTGHTFTGWSVTFTNVSSDLVVRAVYDPLRFSVRFEPGEHGAFASVTAGPVAYGASTPVPPQPVGETGWIFDGWSPALASTVTGDATYTATWRQTRALPSSGYIVVFLAGEHGTFTSEAHENVPAQAATPTPPVPTAHAGWLFDGWSPALSPTVTESVTYTATWRADPSVVPTPPSEPTTPAPDPVTTPDPIIINGPAQPAPATRYVTVTGPAAQSDSSSSDTTTDSGTAADPSTTGSDSAADRATGAGDVELPEEETPLASGQEAAQPQSINVWLILSLVAFALITLIGILLMLRRSREEQQAG